MAVGDDVFIRNYHRGERWLPGVIVKETGPVSFLVRLADGNCHCHQDQIRRRSVDIPEDVIPEPEVTPEVSVSLPPTVPTPPSVPIPTETLNPSVPTDPIPSETTDASSNVTPPIDRTYKSYPKCNRKPVERFEPSW